jgi:tRNA dimethylallyltransferase
MLAQGVRELGAYLDGTLSLPDAIAATQTATRRYAKRQYTWMRHQLPEAHVITRPDEGMDDLTLLRAQ